MNWYQKWMFDYLVKKIGYINLLYTITNYVLYYGGFSKKSILENLIKAYLPGHHVQRSYKGKGRIKPEVLESLRRQL